MFDLKHNMYVMFSLVALVLIFLVVQNMRLRTEIAGLKGEVVGVKSLMDKFREDAIKVELDDYQKLYLKDHERKYEHKLIDKSGSVPRERWAPGWMGGYQN